MRDLSSGARGLAPVHALLHACLHRANNLQFGDGNRLRWLYDLKLFVQRLDAEQWQQLVRLAQALDTGPASLYVYVANRDGSGVRRISGPGYAALPTWSGW